MPFKVKGLDVMRANVRRLQQRFPVETGRVLHDELQEVELPETQRRVPVDTGDLRSTGRVTDPEVRGHGVSCAVTYGGEAESGKDVGYALIVHEDVEALHKVGQAKYVSSVLNESAPYMAQRLAARYDLKKVVE